MKRLFVAMILIVTASSLMASAVAARHVDASKHAHSAQAPASQPQAAPPDAGAISDPAPFWKQIPSSVGLIAGGLLIVVLAGIVIAAVKRSRRYSGPAVYAGDYANSILVEEESRIEPSMRSTGGKPPGMRPTGGKPAGNAVDNAAKAKPAVEVPPGFDVKNFLRGAKANFVHFQAAWDRGDLNDIRQFTTTEMYAAFILQIRKRGNAPNHTTVESVEAELLNLDTSGSDRVARVKFSGMIREEHNEAGPFLEIWRLSKSANRSGWKLAEIQQLQ